MVSVIVPARDASGTLPALLDALAAQDLTERFELIVVDDDSGDGTGALAAAHRAVDIVVPGPGEGPGAARNAGVRVATGDVLAFTDADCVPDPGWLRAGLAALAEHDLVQGRVDPAGPAGPFDRTVSVDRLTLLFETANLLIRRELFDGLGGFEAWLAPRRGKELAEDVWLGRPALRAGARVTYAPEARVRHAVFPRGPGGWIGEQARCASSPRSSRACPRCDATGCTAASSSARTPRASTSRSPAPPSPSPHAAAPRCSRPCPTRAASSAGRGRSAHAGSASTRRSASRATRSAPPPCSSAAHATAPS